MSVVVVEESTVIGGGRVANISATWRIHFRSDMLRPVGVERGKTRVGDGCEKGGGGAERVGWGHSPPDPPLTVYGFAACFPTQIARALTFLVVVM